jgi:hypothetical protein
VKGIRCVSHALVTLSLALPAALFACSGDDDDAAPPTPTTGGAGGQGGAAGDGGSPPIVKAGASSGGEAGGIGGAGGTPTETDGAGTGPIGGAAGAAGTAGEAGAAGAAGAPPAWEPGSPLIVPPGTEIAGKSQSQLGADWWAWIYGAPASTNPLLDETGDDCAVDQPAGVFFLVGNFGGTSVRSCTVPAATPIFLPLVNAETDNCNIEVASQQSEEEQQAFIDATMSSPIDFEVELDGELVVDGLEDGLHYAVGQKQFSYEVPAGDDSMAHYFSVTYGPPNVDFSGTCTPAQSDGYYVGLQGLTAGPHLLRFRSKSSDGFSVNVIYQLTIAP